MRTAKLLTTLSFVLVVTLLAATTVLAGAIDIPLQNNSFEYPEVTDAQGWSDTVTTYWYSPPGSGRINNTTNEYHVDGVTGNQFEYLYANGAGVLGYTWQGGPIDGVTAGTKVEAGKSYTLSADLVGMASFASTSTGATMEMRIGYSSDGITLTTLASKEIKFSDVYNASLTNQKMTNIAFSTPTIESAVDAYLGVWFGITNASGNTNFGIDNVKLSSVPEPSAIVLSVMGLVGLLAYAWRKRK